MNVPSEARASRQTGPRPFQVSFEGFPPKTDVMEERFWESVHKLAPLKPRFVSVTYGAGGSTRERTLRMVTQVKAETGVDAAAHLTCVGATKAEVDQVVHAYKTAGIRKIGDCDISVAAYPEKHPQSPNWDVEIDNLKRKLDAGASRAITQKFFDSHDYLRLLERAAKAGITASIVPGIQPIHSFKQISSFAAKCGASMPDWLARRFDGLEDDPETHALVASAVAAEQVLELVDEGITEFHFLTLYRSNLVLALARLLGVRPD